MVHGVHISPMAFLVVKDGNTKLLTMDGISAVDKLVDLIPDVVCKAGKLLEKSLEKPSKVLKETTIEKSSNETVNENNKQKKEELNPDDFEDEV